MAADMGQSSLLEATLRRDRLVVAGSLSLVAFLAWGWTLAGAGMPMDPDHGMTMMEVIGSISTNAAAWSTSHAAMILLMWWVMMVAMMLPSASPLILLATALHRRKSQDGRPELMAALLTALDTSWSGVSSASPRPSPSGASKETGWYRLSR